MAKHKHAELIKAWAEGARIETYSKRYNRWVNTKSPTWDESTQYRIRKAVVFVEYQVDCIDGITRFKTQKPYNVRFCFTGDGELLSVVKLEGESQWQG